MRILLAGGDGSCGWRGHDVASLIRRLKDAQLGVQTLTPIRSLRERVARWREQTVRWRPHSEKVK
jgi:UDP-sulfoquinovose synthase